MFSDLILRKYSLGARWIGCVRRYFMADVLPNFWATTMPAPECVDSDVNHAEQKRGRSDNDDYWLAHLRGPIEIGAVECRCILTDLSRGANFVLARCVDGGSRTA
jgi:hypothetical protein